MPVWGMGGDIKGTAEKAECLGGSRRQKWGKTRQNAGVRCN